MKNALTSAQKELKNKNLPDVLLMNNGDTVGKENWTQRKKELLDILSENLFGYTPEPPEKVYAVDEEANRFKKFGGKGLVTDGEMPDAGTPLIDGEIGFYVREGTHYMSREDWNVFMDFFDRNL